MYALCILAGVAVAYALTARTLRVRAFEHEHLATVLLVALPCGILGARLYHLVTDASSYFAPGVPLWHTVAIWRGGLGIWGAFLTGIPALILTHRHLARTSDDPSRFASGAQLVAAVMPGVAFAQAIGRFGNWFNQELFGGPSSLPWALHVDAAFRPAGYETVALFHPTFLYESLWMVLGGFVLLRYSSTLSPSRLVALYFTWYTAGRFGTELLRVDPSHYIGALRLNAWVSVLCFVLASIYLFRTRPAR